MNLEEKHQELEKIVKRLCQDQELEKDWSSILKQLSEIYEGEYKHRYSKLTAMILSSTKDREQDLMKLAQNLRGLETRLKQEQYDDNIKKQIEKLYDHMNLECIRLQDSGDRIKQLQSISNELDANYKELKDNLNKQQTQYITILGIFASIVLAFVSGLVFSNSVLSNIEKASIYRLVFVMSFIALFVGNILNALFNFLSNIVSIKDNKSAWYRQSFSWFNGIILFVMIINSLCFIINKEKVTLSKEILDTKIEDSTTKTKIPKTD